MTLIFTRHMCSTWYTSDLYVTTIDTQVLAFPWLLSLNGAVEEIGVTCMQLAGDSFCHVSTHCKSHARQVLLSPTKWKSLATISGLQESPIPPSYKAVNSPKSSCQYTPSNFHVFGPHKKHLTDKWFATDANMKQGVTSFLQTLDTDFF